MLHNSLKIPQEESANGIFDMAILVLNIHLHII